MKRNPQLKKWSSLDEAAEWLTNQLGKHVAPRDLLDFALDEGLVLRCVLRDARVKAAGEYCKLAYDWVYDDVEDKTIGELTGKRKEKLKSLHGKVARSADGPPFKVKDSPCRLVVDSALKNILWAAITDPTQGPVKLRGYCVESPDGSIWEVQDFTPEPGGPLRLMEPGGRMVYHDGTYL